MVLHDTDSLDPTVAAMEASSSCYFNNVLYPQGHFSRQAFTKCWDYMASLHLDQKFGKVTTDGDPMQVVFNETIYDLPSNRLRWNVSENMVSSVEEICANFNAIDVFCSSLKICLQMAISCCDKQIAEQKYLDDGHCPSTWDGLTCFPSQSNGSEVSVKCPDSLIFNIGNVRKLCYHHGEWEMISNYDNCHKNVINHYARLHIAGIVCKCLAILAVIPACIIMLSFRTLRQQQRIRVHLCLLLASLMVAMSTLLSQLLIDESIFQGTETSILLRNPVWCRLLHLCEQYSYMVLFMWMFIEFFHLHRLLMHAFTVPKSLRVYYIFGFGFPLLMTSVYGIIRANDKQLSSKCMKVSTSYHWICNGPNFLALALNLILLFKIVNVLVRQLAPHPNEPSSFRRALKAVAIMMPSLGIQYVLFLWTRPDTYDIVRTIYDLLEEILCSLHGALIALVFCYLNREIQSHVKAPCLRVLRRSSWIHERFTNRSNITTMTTQYASEHNRIHRDGGGDGGDWHRPDKTHTGELLIPLEAITCPVGSKGQVGDNKPGLQSNCDDLKSNGEIIVDDEVTHLDPEGDKH